MPKYLPPEVVKSARERLGTSRAEAAMLDFLVLKRTMTLMAGTRLIPLCGTKRFETRSMR